MNCEKFVKKILFECRCHSPEHDLKFVLDEEDLYVYVLLLPQNFFKRLVNGIRYIFGYSCRYGYFDEFVMNPKDIDLFISMLEQFRENSKSSPGP